MTEKSKIQIEFQQDVFECVWPSVALVVFKLGSCARSLQHKFTELLTQTCRTQKCTDLRRTADVAM